MAEICTGRFQKYPSPHFCKREEITEVRFAFFGGLYRWYLSARLRALQNLIWIISRKLHALQRTEETCNRWSNRHSATQHPHKFIFYRRMHYASFRHILPAVFALLHFTPIKMNRRDFAMPRVFNRTRYSQFLRTTEAHKYLLCLFLKTFFVI